MKIIFLDIDGVLNSRQYDAGRGSADGNIDESRLPLLKRLTDLTGAKVVLTSSWRRHWDPNRANTDSAGKETEQTFGRHGIILHDKTPEIDGDRAKEIFAWLCEHQPIECFVILDDIKFGWGDLEPYVVKTDYRIGRGLENKHIEKALEILLKEE